MRTNKSVAAREAEALASRRKLMDAARSHYPTLHPESVFATGAAEVRALGKTHDAQVVMTAIARVFARHFPTAFDAVEFSKDCDNLYEG